MIVIYHNPKCKIAGKCINILETRNVDQSRIKHEDLVLTEEKLRKILSLLNYNPIDIIRKRHFLWKSLLKNLNFTDDELIKVILQYPKLMKNPIVINGNKAVIGNPPETILDII
ncbi:MAG: arsenate reductase [Bacteroidetes bacterium]|nr:arsenate reductase [Bacteroidota bacterium]